MNKSSNNQAGFTLIELMIVVAIIGILASIAISSYQTYTVRAQVTEGIVFAGNAKVPIVDAFLTRGEAPRNRTEAGLTSDNDDTSTKYIKSLAVVDGRVDVIFGNDANAELADTTLSMTPYETGGGAVVWRCGDAPAPLATDGTPLVTMGTRNGGNAATFQTTTTPRQYLPATCRP